MNSLIRQSNYDFHIHSMYVIWAYISKIDTNINYYMYLKMMSNIYKIFEYLYNNTKLDVNEKMYIKEKIAELIDDIIILINNDIVSHDKNTYLFIIGYYLYIQLINYKKDKFIYDHCIYASGKLFDDHFYQVVSDITNINQLQYIKFIIKIFYIILPFLSSNIYINNTLMKFIDLLINNNITNDIIFQKKCNYILSILNFLQIGIL